VLAPRRRGALRVALDPRHVASTKIDVAVATEVEKADRVGGQEVSHAGSDDGGSHEQGFHSPAHGDEPAACSCERLLV